MVLINDGSSEMVAHIWTESGSVKFEKNIQFLHNKSKDNTNLKLFTFLNLNSVIFSSFSPFLGGFVLSYVIHPIGHCISVSYVKLTISQQEISLCRDKTNIKRRGKIGTKFNLVRFGASKNEASSIFRYRI